MNLEFKVYQIKTDSKFFGIIGQFDEDNEFIVVGEENDYYKVCGINNGQLSTLADVKIDEFAYMFPKEDFELKPDDEFPGAVLIYEFDIPKKNLMMNIIENIKRLNE